jgi:ABC-type transport system substrate-binding protein
MPVVTDGQTQFIMYENGEADIGPAGQVRTDPNSPYFHHLTATRSGGCCFYFGFDFSKPPFEDRDVRAALTHAVDMATIIPIVQPGSKAAAGMINGQLPCNDPAKSVYAYDPAKAKEHLAMSSYGSATNLPPITVSVRSKTFIQIAELMQEALMDNLGVQLNINIYERGQALPPENNIVRLSNGSTIPDYANVVWTLGHSKSGRMADLGIASLPGQAEIDALIDRATLLPLNHPDRCSQFQEVERRTLERYDRIYLSEVAGNPRQNVVQPWLLGYATQWYGDWLNVPYWKIGKRDLSLYPGHCWSPSTVC